MQITNATRLQGVYLADISSKSANYCQSHVSNNTGLLLLCEVELGKPMLELEIGRSDAAELAKQQGCIATWGRGATAPVGWKDAGCVNTDLKGVMMVCVHTSHIDEKGLDLY